ncbi:MAG: hypothetical protein CSA34_01900 [Desulfobulbus propionicus]|nr:MAG: hypothetical protein CSA34_01900 [Desulfobulbus propionicus]
MLHSSVHPDGIFRVGVHRPSYSAVNLRQQTRIMPLGKDEQGQLVENYANFPCGDVEVQHARPVYEIANALTFRGATFINSSWADARVDKPQSFHLPPADTCSLRGLLEEELEEPLSTALLAKLPRQLKCALAATSTDPQELILLARDVCTMVFANDGSPVGLAYTGKDRPVPVIDDFELFETIANNPALPDAYKEVMVLRPGVQGDSPIVGEVQGATHVVEYLRGNSYIPWGHYAANLADDHIRYRTADLTLADMEGMRHLYYQRIFCTLAAQLSLPLPEKHLDVAELEELRLTILQKAAGLSHSATLWGWNFGYDYSASGYRLHASHQMIHQQYAMVPEQVELVHGGTVPTYSCGDLVANEIQRYRDAYGSDFFSDLLSCIRGNRRTDTRDLCDSLIIWEDEHVLLFVPKAQLSQWEVQLLVTANVGSVPVGSVVEADSAVRRSLDIALLKIQHIYAILGATLVTSIEYPKRLGIFNNQRLLYSFLPKLPWSMGAFSEAQGRSILGHYPEDFAAACRDCLS